MPPLRQAGRGGGRAAAGRQEAVAVRGQIPPFHIFAALATYQVGGPCCQGWSHGVPCATLAGPQRNRDGGLAPPGDLWPQAGPGPADTPLPSDPILIPPPAHWAGAPLASFLLRFISALPDAPSRAGQGSSGHAPLRRPVWAPTSVWSPTSAELPQCFLAPLLASQWFWGPCGPG